MLGIIPSASKTFEVIGDLNCKNPIEGKLYYDEEGRLFIYSSTARRSNPDVGYFPIWDGENTYITKFSNNRNVSEITDISISSISRVIDNNAAADIKIRQRKSMADQLLRLEIRETDNMFTQIIKTIINANDWTMIDLVDMCEPKMTMTQLENLYLSLSKISFMRIERWFMWTDIILHLRFTISVTKGTKMLVEYSHPEEIFNTGIIKYDTIIQDKSDPFKKIVKILIVQENITKTTITNTNKEVDGYTVNNMFTTILSTKPFSAQLFSRFIRITGLEYEVKVYNKKNELVVDYKE